MKTIADDTRTNILQEQFIPDNVFIYILKGEIRVFDGCNSLIFKSGDACVARKNRFAKYELLESKDEFLPILFCFDEPFLRKFQEKYSSRCKAAPLFDTFIEVKKTDILESFIQSIKPYFKAVMRLEEAFEDLKYEELLLILLRNQPELADLLFDFSKPGKIDLEKFINQNYCFNVSTERFAYLSGRSLSSFKRDFKEVFNDTPSHWLVQKRLDEAYFLLKNAGKKPSDIFLDLGFESLSHFSTAFKNKFGYAPRNIK